MNETQILKSNILTTLPSVGTEYSVSFDLLVDKHTDHAVRSVLHLTTKENDSKLGNRIPAVFLYRNKMLHISSAVNGNPNYYVNINQPLKEGQWYKIQIQQVKRNDKVGL